MAEKEEIIFIDLIEGGCAKCPHEYGNCERCYYRQEAIERIAKALFKVDNVLALDIEFEQLTKQKQLTYKVFAEAALNALLGE